MPRKTYPLVKQLVILKSAKLQSGVMMHRIRKAMSDNTNLLKGIIEMDETYVGGKPH